MKILRFILVLILLVTGVSSGCGIFSGKANAEKEATSFFEAIQDKDFDTAMTFYSPKFFEITPEVDWIQALKGVNTKLGDLENYELTSWSSKTIKMIAGTEEGGTYYVLQYEVTYSKHPATETLTLFKPTNGDKYSIVGHTINSIALLFE